MASYIQAHPFTLPYASSCLDSCPLTCNTCRPLRYLAPLEADEDLELVVRVLASLSSSVPIATLPPPPPPPPPAPLERSPRLSQPSSPEPTHVVPPQLHFHQHHIRPTDRGVRQTREWLYADDDRREEEKRERRREKDRVRKRVQREKQRKEKAKQARLALATASSSSTFIDGNTALPQHFQTTTTTLV